jgi:hypothetical protein
MTLALLLQNIKPMGNTVKPSSDIFGKTRKSQVMDRENVSEG